MTLTEYLTLKRELREIEHSMEWAYAMGHGCTMGGRDPRLQEVVDRADALRERIRTAEQEALT